METQSNISIQIPEIFVSWKIKNFSQCKALPGAFVRSEEFSVATKSNGQWFIKLYPLGKNNKSIGFISIFLHCVAKRRDDIPSLFKFSLHDTKGTCLMELKKSTYYSSDLSKGWGYSHFCEYHEILNHLEDDVLVVHCWMQWKTNINTAEKLSALDKTDVLIELSNDYEALMKDKSFSDIILEANDGIEFAVHKCILASRSPIFAEIFTEFMPNNPGIKFQIQDFDGKTLKAVLDFIYSGKFKEDEYQIVEVFVAAEKYNLKMLKELCADILIRDLKIDNCVKYLILSDLHDANSLKKCSLSFISKNLKDVVKTNYYQDLAFEKPHLLLEILTALAK